MYMCIHSDTNTALVMNFSPPTHTHTHTHTALHNPEVASQSGAIRALIRGLLKCGASRISESVTLTLSHLLNSQATRKFIRSQLDIEVSRSVLIVVVELACCTDLVHFVDKLALLV